MTRRRALGLGLALLRPGAALGQTGGQTGLASWYGGWHHGRRMASGRRFDQWGPNAAHRHLPFGTRCLVRHLGNGRAATVTIEDRGPFIRGRIIDLSRGTARALGGEAEGVFRVEVRPL